MKYINNPLFLSLIILSCVTDGVIAQWFLYKHTVHIINNFTDGSKPLIFRCQSGDDDLGVKSLAKGREFHFTFGLQIFTRTLFFCRLRRGNAYNRSFDVFRDPLDIHLCKFKHIDGEYYWQARKDGIYFS
ncbi:hypothetical protein RND81_04G065900, partial [Saponaria officinalis]